MIPHDLISMKDAPTLPPKKKRKRSAQQHHRAPAQRSVRYARACGSPTHGKHGPAHPISATSRQMSSCQRRHPRFRGRSRIYDAKSRFYMRNRSPPTDRAKSARLLLLSATANRQNGPQNVFHAVNLRPGTRFAGANHDASHASAGQPLHTAIVDDDSRKRHERGPTSSGLSERIQVCSSVNHRVAQQQAFDNPATAIIITSSTACGRNCPPYRRPGRSAPDGANACPAHTPRPKKCSRS